MHMRASSQLSLDIIYVSFRLANVDEQRDMWGGILLPFCRPECYKAGAPGHYDGVADTDGNRNSHQPQ